MPTIPEDESEVVDQGLSQKRSKAFTAACCPEPSYGLILNLVFLAQRLGLLGEPGERIGGGACVAPSLICSESADTNASRIAVFPDAEPEAAPCGLVDTV